MIKIEERFWNDKRFKELTSSLGKDAAIGVCVRAWKLALSFYIPDETLIPLTVWNNEGLPYALIEYKFAELKPGDFVYVKGIKEHVKGIKTRTRNLPTVKSNETAQTLTAIYCEMFKARYGTNPPITGKDIGILKQLAKDVGQAKAVSLVESFFQMNDPYFVKRRHDLGALATSVKAVAVYKDTGKTTNTIDIKHEQANSFHEEQRKRLMGDDD